MMSTISLLLGCLLFNRKRKKDKSQELDGDPEECPVNSSFNASYSPMTTTSVDLDTLQLDYKDDDDHRDRVTRHDGREDSRQQQGKGSLLINGSVSLSTMDSVSLSRIPVSIKVFRDHPRGDGSDNIIVGNHHHPHQVKSLFTQEKDVYQLLSSSLSQHRWSRDCCRRTSNYFLTCLGCRETTTTLSSPDVDNVDEIVPILEYQLVLSPPIKTDLRSFLRDNTIDWKSFCSMSGQVSSALSFLHSEVKPSIAHRAISSRSIYVTRLDTMADSGSDISLVLADLESAVLLPPALPLDNNIGEVRYRSPEILDGSILSTSGSSLIQSDIYSLSLILWELATRCSDLYQGLPTPTYKLPFQSELSSGSRTIYEGSQDPPPEQMYILVCRHKARPLLADIWKESNPAIRSLRETMTDCWDSEPNARLTATCVEKRMSELPKLWEKYKADNQRHGKLSTSSFSGTPSIDRKSILSTPSLNNILHEKGQQEGQSVRSLVVPKNVNEMSGGKILIEDLLSFPVQPYQGRNPCLERNLLNCQLSSLSSLEERPLLLTTTSKYPNPFGVPVPNSWYPEMGVPPRPGNTSATRASNLRRNQRQRRFLRPIPDCIQNDFTDDLQHHYHHHQINTTHLLPKIANVDRCPSSPSTTSSNQLEISSHNYSHQEILSSSPSFSPMMTEAKKLTLVLPNWVKRIARRESRRSILGEEEVHDRQVVNSV